MQIQILCIGKIKDAWIASGIAEFEKRLRPYAKVFVTELAEVRIPDNASATEEQRVKEKEGELLLTSEDLAKSVGDAKIEGANLCFIIGGPLGLSPALLSSVPKKVSFSKMTFTHTMCRLILFEQIYRAFRIVSGEPYHK